MVSLELNYDKVNEESLSVLFAIQIHKDYIYGIKFVVFKDNKPLVSMFNNHSKVLTEWVVRQTSKLQAF